MKYLFWALLCVLVIVAVVFNLERLECILWLIVDLL